ncbi:MAG: hypothetical protein RL662_2463 [Bacteroidota bacterium]|jgi:polysaccharide export outer membrane protein
MKQIKNFSLYIGVSLLLMSLLLLPSCTTSKSVNLLQDKKPVYTARPYTDYKLQYKDEIICSIFTSNKDFSDVFNSTGLDNLVSAEGQDARTAYTIYENGAISIPFFGDISVVGRTLAEAEEIIQARMKQAIPDAQVKVFLRNNAYYVVSDEKTGRFELYKDNMTIYQALAQNGRPSGRIDLSKVKIVRTEASTGKSVIKTFDLRTESLVESEFYYIKPNDLIYYSTSSSAFFRINSISSLLSTLALPLTTVAAVFAIMGNYK